MPSEAKSTKRISLIFLISGSLALLITMLFAVLGQKVSTHFSSDFLSLKKEFVEVGQLSFEKYAQLKLRIATTSERPACGLFGAHMVGWMGASPSHGKPIFNYSIYHASLYERLQLLRYLSTKEKLPTDCIILALPHPQFGPDQYLQNWGELPEYVGRSKQRESMFGEAPLEFAAVTAHLYKTRFENAVRSTLDWKNVIRGIQLSLSRLFSDDSKIGKTISQYNITDIQVYRENWFLNLKDGATIRVRSHGEKVGPVNFYETSSAVVWDIERIAQQIREIEILCLENDLQLILIIPPVYMQRNLAHKNERAVTELIGLFPHLTIRDHRGEVVPEFFDYDAYHPTSRYWDRLEL